MRQQGATLAASSEMSSITLLRLNYIICQLGRTLWAPISVQRIKRHRLTTPGAETNPAQIAWERGKDVVLVTGTVPGRWDKG